MMFQVFNVLINNTKVFRDKMSIKSRPSIFENNKMYEQIVYLVYLIKNIHRTTFNTAK